MAVLLQALVGSCSGAMADIAYSRAVASGAFCPYVGSGIAGMVAAGVAFAVSVAGVACLRGGGRTASVVAAARVAAAVIVGAG